LSNPHSIPCSFICDRFRQVIKRRKSIQLRGEEETLDPKHGAPAVCTRLTSVSAAPPASVLTPTDRSSSRLDARGRVSTRRRTRRAQGGLRAGAPRRVNKKYETVPEAARETVLNQCNTGVTKREHLHGCTRCMHRFLPPYSPRRAQLHLSMNMIMFHGPRTHL
jgi:hypothetical protein